MAGLCKAIQRHSFGFKKVLGLQEYWNSIIRLKFTKARIPHSLYEEQAKNHEKYGGDPEHPHKLHLITRIRSGLGRPYWEKKTLKDLGLIKAHHPYVHKNIPAVNEKLKVIKHLVRIQPLKLPQGFPTEEELTQTYLKSTGELVIEQRPPKTADKKTIAS
ncbi:39S ribosomal protein L30, mitochondrial isoform X1 [Polypterus senegalus]|nr:39S ribosomal protein L30, mitochondrial isoform X1 [Polypterus senegalus]